MYYVHFNEIKELMKKENIKLRLEKPIALFKAFDLKDWEKAYKDLLLYLQDNPKFYKYQLLISFGGMGSINDFILHYHGVPLIEESND